jgi:hypothetical protein
MTVVRSALLLVPALFTGALLASPPAGADYDPVGGGMTRLTIDKGFSALLADHEVRLIATESATRRGSTYTLSPSGGRLDPTKAKGVVEQEGNLVFQRGVRRVLLRKVELKTKSAPLVAKVGGSQLKVATSSKLFFERRGFGVRISARDLRLTEKFATRLAKKLQLHGIFEQGQLLGSMRSDTQPETLAVLDRGKATLVLDPSLVAKLNSLFVSINPIFPTELSPGNVFSVPFIRDGVLSPDASIGLLRTAGTIEFLQQGAGQVFLTEFWFDMGTKTALAEIEIEPTPTFKGKLGQLPAVLVGAGLVSANPGARTIGVTGAPLTLSAQTAAAFNEGFAEGKATFSAGERFGTLSFTAQTQ